jgi:hypothetical protein
MRKFTYCIGIDPGTKTGVSIWSCKDRRLLEISTEKIHDAMSTVKRWHEFNPGEVYVRFEDARQRKWFGNNSHAKLQGAGSIKRDCKIWEDYLTDLKVPFEMVAPKKGATKMSAEKFRAITGYTEKTSEHARDSAWLVIGM